MDTQRAVILQVHVCLLVNHSSRNGMQLTAAGSM